MGGKNKSCLVSYGQVSQQHAVMIKTLLCLCRLVPRIHPEESQHQGEQFFFSPRTFSCFCFFSLSAACLPACLPTRLPTRLPAAHSHTPDLLARLLSRDCWALVHRLQSAGRTRSLLSDVRALLPAVWSALVRGAVKLL